MFSDWPNGAGMGKLPSSFACLHIAMATTCSNHAPLPTSPAGAAPPPPPVWAAPPAQPPALQAAVKEAYNSVGE